MKVRYLYAGARKNKFKGVVGKDYPDTQFYGLDHLKEFGVDADYREWSDFPLSRLLGAITGFRQKHVLLYAFSIGQDVVFGSSLLYAMLWRALGRTDTKAVLLNISMTRLLTANKKKRFTYALLRFLLRKLDAIVCLARFQQAFLEAEFPFLKGKTFFIPLGVDADYYAPAYDDRKDYFFSVGRDNGRDYKTLIEAARLSPEREFHIACSRRNLEGIGDIPGNVTVFYDLPPAEVQEKLRRAALLLLITHGDTLTDGADCSGQTVLLEAMASGIPIIVSRKQYLSDYVAEGQEAMVVENYDAAQIQVKAETLMRDSVLREAMGRRARARVERDFSTRRMAERLAKLFTALCAGVQYSDA